MIRIAIFASGAGSNAQQIITYFKNRVNAFSGQPETKIAATLIVCNKPEAGVLDIGQNEKIETLLIEKEIFFRGDAYVDELRKRKIDFIILAGFLWKIPDPLLNAFPRSIINIHPALLPKYGGKGMYGSFVHEAVINAKETTSGITIHYVDGQYDNGDIIFQATCRINETDTPQSLAQKIHALEHAHYPRIIEMEINRQLANLADH